MVVQAQVASDICQQKGVCSRVRAVGAQPIHVVLILQRYTDYNGEEI